MVTREILIFERNKSMQDFQQFETIRSFDKNFVGGKISLNNADEDQSDLLVEIMNIKEKKEKTQSKESK